ncbi:MAG: response regulator [Gemmataceae bacterium]
MLARAIRVLHVEDDAIQRRLLQQHLKNLPEFDFEVTSADSEDEAIDRMRRGCDIVLLDYHLQQGNGLNCLKRIRQTNPHLPVVAISGVATPEIAAELLEAGADDYFSKDGLEADLFGRSVRAALARADAWKARAPEIDNAMMSSVVSLFEGLCSDFAEFAEPTFLERLDKLEEKAKTANLSFSQTLRLFETVCDRFATKQDPARIKRLLRPVMLEVVLRLFEENPVHG